MQSVITFTFLVAASYFHLTLSSVVTLAPNVITLEDLSQSMLGPHWQAGEKVEGETEWQWAEQHSGNLVLGSCTNTGLINLVRRK